MKSEIGRRVKQARLKADLTQELLAERTNLSTSFISRLENGNVMPSIPRLCELAAALDVGLQDLLFDLFTYNVESEKTKEELIHSIELLPPHEADHLLAYVKLLNKLLDKE